jgi:hypothetical protein
MALVEITRLDWSVARLRAEMARTADAAHFDIRRHARGAGKLRQAPADQARPAVHLGEAGQRLRQARSGWLGERPVTEAIHRSGPWAARLLAVTLAVTPLRLASRWPKLISIRRILGVAVLAYTGLHLALYILNKLGNPPALPGDTY